VTAPFDLRVYSKAFGLTGLVNAPLEVTATMRHNAIGSLDLTLASDDPKCALLEADGARVVALYRGEHLISGPVRGARGSGSMMSGTFTFTVEDDKRLLWRMLGWVNPTGTLAQQGAVTAYRKVTGPAETVFKTLVAENATRLALPVTVAATQGRGTSITVQVRMHTLAERLLPAIETPGGIGFTVTQSGAGLVVDCYTPRVYPRQLTELGGVIRNWDYSRTGHTATRTVVGGQGEGTAREFLQVVGTALEASSGDIVETFTDARDTAVTAEQTERGTEALAEGAPTTGFKVELAETETFRYGGTHGVRVGDQVTLNIGGRTVTDILREVTVSWTRDGGLVVSPSAGGFESDPTVRLAKFVGRSLRRVNNLLLR
jgi:hypothetical protein